MIHPLQFEVQILVIQLQKKNVTGKEKKQTKSITKTSSTRALLFKVKCLAVTQKTKKKDEKEKSKSPLVCESQKYKL